MYFRVLNSLILILVLVKDLIVINLHLPIIYAIEVVSQAVTSGGITMRVERRCPKHGT